MGQLWGVRGWWPGLGKAVGLYLHTGSEPKVSPSLQPLAQWLWTGWGEAWEVAQHHGYGLASRVR